VTDDEWARKALAAMLASVLDSLLIEYLRRAQELRG